MVTIGNIACSALPGPVCSVANIGKEGCTYVAFILFREVQWAVILWVNVNVVQVTMSKADNMT